MRFDPDRVAGLELAMWKAYYSRRRLRLFWLLATLLREQHGHPRVNALRAARRFARAAAAFADSRGDHQQVLAELVAAFALAPGSGGAGFDPARVARAELAWWVARRTPGDDSVANVGRLIAELYAVHYAVPATRVFEAGRLRAEAAALRDRGAPEPDWARIAGLLRASYRTLVQALRA